MFKYFFHFRDGSDFVLDEEGIDLSPSQIPGVALKDARAIIGGDAIDGLVDLRPRIDVENAAGQIVHSLSFEEAVKVVRA